MNANTQFTVAGNAVMKIDLASIKMKLMHVASGEGWSLDKANAVEREYRRFLCLMKLYPNEATAPLADVDTFWHYHILDTMKYAADCEQVFGYFLHHYPYVGMGDEDDEQFRLDSGDRMRALYEATFGDAYPGSIANDVQAAAFCAGPLPAQDKLPARGIGLLSTIAFCAGPLPAQDNLPARGIDLSSTIAFCAGPLPAQDKRPERGIGLSSTIAFCAGPLPAQDKLSARAIGLSSTIAFCAGPLPAQDKLSARAVDLSSTIAFCAGPTLTLTLTHDKLTTRDASAGSVCCAGPTHDEFSVRMSTPRTGTATTA